MPEQVAASLEYADNDLVILGQVRSEETRGNHMAIAENKAAGQLAGENRYGAKVSGEVILA